MRRKRRHHSPAFKSKVALEALKEQKTLAQLCEHYELHANQIAEWKKTLLEGSQTLFTKSGTATSVPDLDALHAPYLEQIGMLQMELAFMKKKLKQLGQA